MVNARSEITQVVRRRSTPRKIVSAQDLANKNWSGEVGKANILNKGLLAVTLDEEKTLSHMGVKAFVNAMRGKGLLNNSLEKSLERLSTVLADYAKLKSHGKRGLKNLSAVKGQVQTQMATVQAILEKGEKAVKVMDANVNHFVNDFDQTLVLVKRIVKTAVKDRNKIDSEFRDVRGASELVAATKTALRYLKNNVKPLFSKISKNYEALKVVILKGINDQWKTAQKGNNTDLSKLQDYNQKVRQNVNDILKKAEQAFAVEGEEKKYLKIIEGLTMRMASTSSPTNLTPYKSEPAMRKAEPKKSLWGKFKGLFGR